MIWLDYAPELLIDVVISENIVKVSNIENFPLIVVLTKSMFYLYDKCSLLPILSRIRDSSSISRHGINVDIKIGNVHETCEIKKSKIFFLYVHTDLNYIIIYKCIIDFNSFLYEMNSYKEEDLNDVNNVSNSYFKYSLRNLFKSDIRNEIDQKKLPLLKIENIEHDKNSSNDYYFFNHNIHYVKIYTIKIIKFKIAVDHYWLKKHSTYLYLFGNDKDNSINNNTFQIVNFSNLNHKLFKVIDMNWYSNNFSSMHKIIYVRYNVLHDYFMFVNSLNEVWYLKFIIKRNFVVTSEGIKLMDLLTQKQNINFKISFNTNYDLLLLNINNETHLYEFNFFNKKLVLLKKFAFFNLYYNNVFWSSCGNYIFFIDNESGYWIICSKFGTKFFDSYEYDNQIENNNDKKDFLKVSFIFTLNQSLGLFLLNKDKTKFYFLNFLILNNFSKLLFYTKNYIVYLNESEKLIKFSLLNHFKMLINEVYYSNFYYHSINIKMMNFKIQINDFNQLSLSYGDFISISTSISKDKINYNHILWYNFQNNNSYLFNITNHFWFKDKLILINRKFYNNKISNSKYTNQNDKYIDEILLLKIKSFFSFENPNCSFDSNLIFWEKNFETTFILSKLFKESNSSSILILITIDYQLIKVVLSQLDDFDNSKDNFTTTIQIHNLINLNNRVKINCVIDFYYYDENFWFFLTNIGLLILVNNLNNSNKLYTKNDNKKHFQDFIINKLYDCVDFFNIKQILINGQIYKYLYIYFTESFLIIPIDNVINDFKILINHNNDNKKKKINKLNIDNLSFIPLMISTSIETSSISRLLVLIGLETTFFNEFETNYLNIKNKIVSKNILQYFIDFDLKYDLISSNLLIEKYSLFKNFDLSLEMLLSSYLTHKQSDRLNKLLVIIKKLKNKNLIYINSLRKIDSKYWNNFFELIKVSSFDFMMNLINFNELESCHKFLFVYLNNKKILNEKSTNVKTKDLIDSDVNIILKIFELFKKQEKWDICFELCRFIVKIDPSKKIINQIRHDYKI